MYGFLDEALHYVIRLAVLLLEAVGASVIVCCSFNAVRHLIRHDANRAKALMAEGISNGLTLLLGSEVLNTILVPDWHDVGIACAILAMRAGISILIRWENRESAKKAEEP